MIDARYNTHNVISRHSTPFKVITCLITLMAFFINILSYDLALLRPLGFVGQAWAAGLASANPDETVSPVSQSIFKELNPGTFALPQYLGTIKDAWAPVLSASRRGRPSPIVIQIQDAHCNYNAQKKIAEIIKYINDNYGIGTVNLEGGAKEYDLSAFTSIANRAIRKRTADYFVKEGLVNGAEYFAINNPEKAVLWGIEDPELYIENLKVYRNSLSYKQEVEASLKSLSYILTNLKIKIYSKELLEFDTKYSQYKSDNIELKEYIAYLLGEAKAKAIDIKPYRNISLLNQAQQEESAIDFNTANNERDRLIDMLHKKLSMNTMEELVVKTVEFKAEKIPQKDFYAYLVDKASKAGIGLADLPEFAKYIAYIALYDAMDKMKVMDEVDILETKIKDASFENESQRDLARLSKNLAIMKNLFNISLTRDDYRYYKANEDAFAVRNFASFIEKEAPLVLDASLRGHEVAEAISKSGLDGYREDISKFYEYSFKRDEAFLRNIRFTLHASRPTILITGGFHTDNLCDMFRKEGISYISILPNFVNDTGYESPYFTLLSGRENGIVEKISTIISSASMQIASMLSNAIASEVWGRANIDAFRAAVLIQEKIEQGKKVQITDKDGNLIAEFGEDKGKAIESMTVAQLIDRVKPGLPAPGQTAVIEPPVSEIAAPQVTPPTVAPANTREELLLRFKDFKRNAKEGDWVVKFDGPRIGATNNVYGREATDWYVAEMIKKTVIDFAIQNNIPAEVGDKGSEEFTFCFPAALTENDIRIKMDELMQKLREKCGQYQVITLKAKLNSSQITELENAGAKFVFSVGVEGQMNVRTKIILDMAEEGNIIKLLESIGQIVDSNEGLRVPYPVSAATRLGMDTDNAFGKAYLAADKWQEQYKNTPIEDGGELVIFEPPMLKMEKEKALIELNVDGQDRKLIEEAVSTKAADLSSTPYVVEEIYGVYHRDSLGRLLADLHNMPLSERTAGTYLIRGPPNEFYVIDVKTDGSFELVKFDTLFFASDPNMAEQFNRILASDRAPFNTKYDTREMFGFKAVNTVFGHATGGNFIIKAIRYSLEKAFDEHRDASLEEKTDLAAGELNRIFSSNGFGCFMMASHITEGEAADNKGYKDFADSAITRVDDLIRARDVLIPKEIPSGDIIVNYIVKSYSAYKDMESAIADNLDLARYHNMTAGEKVIKAVDADLAAKAQYLHEAVGRISSGGYAPGTYRTEVTVEEGTVTVTEYNEAGTITGTARTLSDGERVNIIAKIGGGALLLRSPARAAKMYDAGTYLTQVSVDEGVVLVRTYDENDDIADQVFLSSGQSVSIVSRIKAPVDFVPPATGPYQAGIAAKSEALKNITEPLPAPADSTSYQKELAAKTAALGMITEPVAPGTVSAPAEAEVSIGLQAAAAKTVIKDISKGTADIIVMPGSDIYQGPQAATNSRAARKLRDDYGQNTVPYSYKFGDDWMENLGKQVLPNAMSELQDRIGRGDDTARAIIFVPFEGVTAVKDVIKNIYPQLAGSVSVVGETDIPESGMIDNVMHIVLGKGLLNYSRYNKDMTIDSQKLLVDLIKLLVSNPEEIDIANDPNIVNNILNGLVPLRIKPIDFKEIGEWKKMQDAVLMSL